MFFSPQFEIRENELFRTIFQFKFFSEINMDAKDVQKENDAEETDLDSAFAEKEKSAREESNLAKFSVLNQAGLDLGKLEPTKENANFSEEVANEADDTGEQRANFHELSQIGGVLSAIQHFESKSDLLDESSEKIEKLSNDQPNMDEDQPTIFEPERQTVAEITAPTAQSEENLEENKFNNHDNKNNEGDESLERSKETDADFIDQSEVETKLDVITTDQDNQDLPFLETIPSDVGPLKLVENEVQTVTAIEIKPGKTTKTQRQPLKPRPIVAKVKGTPTILKSNQPNLSLKIKSPRVSKNEVPPDPVPNTKDVMDANFSKAPSLRDLNKAIKNSTSTKNQLPKIALSKTRSLSSDRLGAKTSASTTNKLKTQNPTNPNQILKRNFSKIVEKPAQKLSGSENKNKSEISSPRPDSSITATGVNISVDSPPTDPKPNSPIITQLITQPDQDVKVPNEENTEIPQIQQIASLSVSEKLLNWCKIGDWPNVEMTIRHPREKFDLNLSDEVRTVALTNSPIEYILI